MQVWSVGLSAHSLHACGVNEFSNSTFRYFANGLELITALRENTLGRLAILLTLRLPVLDGLGVIRLLQQEGWIDQHHFILTAPTLPESERLQLETWNVQVVTDPGVVNPAGSTT